MKTSLRYQICGKIIACLGSNTNSAILKLGWTLELEGEISYHVTSIDPLITNLNWFYILYISEITCLYLPYIQRPYHYLIAGM